MAVSNNAKERVKSWITYSVILSVIPILFSLFSCATHNVKIQLYSYIGELIFISVSLSATSIDDIFNFPSGINNSHIPGFKRGLIINLVCSALLYADFSSTTNVENIAKVLFVVFTISSLAISIIIGICCQIIAEDGPSSGGTP